MKKYILLSIMFLAVVWNAMSSRRVFSPDVPLTSTQTKNYVLTKSYISATDYIQDIVYSDGFGRKFQEMAVGASPSGHDIVQVYRYGLFGRTDQEYLPFTRSQGSNGAFLGDPYETSNWNVLGSDAACAFAKTIYEGSPLGRPVKTVGAGTAWHSADKGVIIDYQLNAANEVKLWRVNGTTLTDGGYYAAGALTKTITKDEDGHEVQEFKDNQDRIILSQAVSGITKLQTHYVYDDYGLLRYVLTPEAFQPEFSVAKIPLYCYVYRYDSRQRLIEKKLPGDESIYYVYDAKDRLVLSQDGNQRSVNKWSYTLYNRHNMPVETGETVNLSTREALAAQLGTVQDYTPADRTALQYTVYGKYPVGAHAFSDIHNISQTTPFQTIAGLVTDIRTRVVGTETFIHSTIYYDDYCRPIQTITDGYPAASYKSYYSFRYDFVGNVVEERETHQTGTNSFDVVVRSHTYDNRGRLLSQTATLNGTPATVSYTYDDLGRLVGKNYGGGIYEESLTYNIRGWLTGKSSPQFSMQLRYESPGIAETAACYNGNISEWEWQQETGAEQCYRFGYDPFNRLGSGMQFSKSGTEWNATNLFNEYDITYDNNGNIQTLKRNANGSLTDNLSYSYSGNRLTGLSGVSGAYTYDPNGNMTKDARKGCLLQYNSLNLVQSVTEVSGSARAAYDWLSDGTKLRVLGADGRGYTYRGSLIYNAEGLESAAFDGGRIVWSPTAAMATVQYHITDHLGSVRLIVDGSGGVVERNDYYPFGGRHEVAGSDLNGNRFKYSGKELQTTGDLGYLDYGARMYDPKVGRWFGVDPLAEKYYSLSSYNYCGNSPILFIDPNGEDYWSTNNPDLIAGFLGSLKNGYTMHDFTDWKHVEDEEFVANLTYNDEKHKYYTSYGDEINGEATIIGLSFDAYLLPVVNYLGYKGAFVDRPVSGFWEHVGYYTGLSGRDEYFDGLGTWNVNTSGRLTSIVPMGGIAPIPGMKASTIRSVHQKANYLKELAKSKKTPRWMNNWLHKGKVPPGYQVDHIQPLSIGGKDIPANMKLNTTINHRLHHKWYRPWQKK